MHESGVDAGLAAEQRSRLRDVIEGHVRTGAVVRVPAGWSGGSADLRGCDPLTTDDRLREALVIIWRGWGVLAFVYAAVGMILFAGVASTLVPESVLPFTIGIGLLLAAVATWFTGIALNRTSPRRKIDAWAQERKRQLDDLVVTGRFSLGPGQPQPTSVAQAQEMADALFAHELAQAQRAFNVHTLFWIPMQYLAFVWGAIALAVIVIGAVQAMS